jgi:methionyl-tRNA formyltransferase
MKTVVIGGVDSTLILIEELISLGIRPNLVCGYEPASTHLVSAWADLRSVARSHSLPFMGFESVNDGALARAVRDAEPDWVFLVGLSQLAPPDLLEVAPRRFIGFHPTQLPRGRGRAPVAWIVLTRCPGAATFFQITEGVDEGPILAQVPFQVTDIDDAASVTEKLLKAMRIALRSLIPALGSGAYTMTLQDEQKATYFGRRTPDDGRIEWTRTARDIDLLIKSATHPHPGAFTFWRDRLLTVWTSHLEPRNRIRGVIGRVLDRDDARALLVQTGDGLLWLTEYEIENNPIEQVRTGDRLGYDLELEIYRIKKYLSGA